MLDRKCLLDLALQYPKYRGPLVRMAAHLTAYSIFPTPQEVAKAVSEAGKMDSVDPAVATYVVQSGLLDGEAGDDKVQAGKGSWGATSLHPSQKTMVLPKAIGMALGMLKSGKIGGDLGAIVSKDKHILDGHHRWAATILAGGSKGKVGGYAASLPGKDLLKVLNIISKGLFKVRNGKAGKGAIADFKPENVRKMLKDFTVSGIGGNHPWTADDVKSTLEKAFGSVEAGIDTMSENVKLMSQAVPGWAPDRKQMPVINPEQVPAVAKALGEGVVDFAAPHAPGSKTAGHHQGTDGKWYVDTAFINKCQRVPGVSVEHMGFGEFYAETPKGRVDFDRMRGKKFEGQSGRSHQMYGEGADWLVKQVEKGGHSDRMAGTRRTARRHERGLSPQTLDWLVEGAADSAEIENSREAEATSAVKTLAKKFERDLEKAMEGWHQKNPDALVEDMEVDDLLDDGAAYLVLMTLRGEGVGIWDGDWDHYFVDGDRGIKVLERHLEQKLGQYADDTGGGSLNEALEEAAYETTGSMDKYGSQADPTARGARIRLAATLPVRSEDRRVILAGLSKVGVTSDRPPQISLRSPIAALKKAESLYEVDGSRDGDVLHHLGEALSEMAWVVKDLGDPQAEKLMDMARSFSAMHR